MPRIAGDRAHSLEVESLPIENVVCEALFQKFHQILCRPSTNKARLYSGLLHHPLEVTHKCQGDSTRPCLKGEAIAHDAGVAQETCDELRDSQTVWRSGDLRGAGDDLRR